MTPPPPTHTQILEAQRAVDLALAARDAARAQRDAAIAAEKVASAAYFAALQHCIHLQNLAALAAMTDAERATLRGPCPQGDAARPWVTLRLAVWQGGPVPAWKWTGKAKDLRAALGVE